MPNPVDVGQARERVEVLKSQVALLDKEIATRTADQQRIAHDLADYQAKIEQRAHAGTGARADHAGLR